MWRELLGLFVGEAVREVKRRLTAPTDAELRTAARAALALAPTAEAVRVLVHAESWLAAHGVELTGATLTRLRVAVAIACIERDTDIIEARARDVAEKLGSLK
jgi:hypothetical protein